MKKLFSSALLCLPVIANAQFVPGQVLTASQLNNQFALYAPLGGASFTGGISAAGITGTPISGSTGSFTTLSASGAVSGTGFTSLLSPYALLASPTFTGTVTANNLTVTGTATLPAIALSGLAAQAANTAVANVTSGSASPTAVALPSCSTSASALNYTSGTGFGCNTAINAAQLGGATFASPTAIGSTTPSTGAFTTLSASSTVSGAGFASYLSSPPSIGNTVAGTGAFTTLTTSSTFTPSQTAGIVGTTTNNNANAGSVGEFISSSVSSGSPTSISSGTAFNLVSISLTAGDWDVEGAVGFIPAAGTTVTAAQASSSLVSATLQDAVVGGRFRYPFSDAAGNGPVEGGVTNVRYSLSATTTVFMVANAVFSGSTCTAYGIIRARRVR